MNDVTGENTSTYALSDIVTSWLDEIDTNLYVWYNAGRGDSNIGRC